MKAQGQELERSILPGQACPNCSTKLTDEQGKLLAYDSKTYGICPCGKKQDGARCLVCPGCGSGTVCEKSRPTRPSLVEQIGNPEASLSQVKEAWDYISDYFFNKILPKVVSKLRWPQGYDRHEALQELFTIVREKYNSLYFTTTSKQGNPHVSEATRQAFGKGGFRKLLIHELLYLRGKVWRKYYQDTRVTARLFCGQDGSNPEKEESSSTREQELIQLMRCRQILCQVLGEESWEWQAFQLRFPESKKKGLTYDEIAKLLETTLARVYSSIQTSLEILRRIFESELCIQQEDTAYAACSSTIPSFAQPSNAGWSNQIGPESIVGKPLDPCGRYIARKLLATGGQGVVFLAEDTRLGREVAAKIIPGTNDLRIPPFLNSLAGIPVVYEKLPIAFPGGPDDEICYTIIAMEYVGDISIRQTLDKGGTSLAVWLGYLLEICKILAWVHGHGYIHADIKNANIRLCPAQDEAIGDTPVTNFRPYLIDWESMVNLGQPRRVYTLNIDSPGSPSNPRHDIYCLGNILYEITSHPEVLEIVEKCRQAASPYYREYCLERTTTWTRPIKAFAKDLEILRRELAKS